MQYKKYATLATCQLNQWAMSFAHNKRNVIKSIQMARQLGASYRLGPELELSGYGCEDHFFELDTVKHCWQSIQEILADKELTKDMICDVGMPVHFKNTLYNCRVICLNQQILLIRPKLFLAGGNNYRESRWFTGWSDIHGLQEYKLPDEIRQITNQTTTQIGNAIISCNDTEIAVETCEELWVPKNPHVDFGLDGVEIFMNGSGSHHELRKLQNNRLSLIQTATQRNGGIYVYSNLKGCDGGRMYFDGCSLVSMNGKIYEQAQQFSIDEIEVTLGVMDMDQVRAARAGNFSRSNQSSNQKAFQRVHADIDITRYIDKIPSKAKQDNEVRIHTPEEEIAYGPALWMWDYLRRSGARGFFLPLSGGADSAAVAAIVASMSKLVFESVQAGNQETLVQIRKVVKNENFNPKTYQEIVSELLVTSYLSSKNSSDDTRDRAKRLAEGIGAYHFNIGIDEAYDKIVGIFEAATDKKPKYESQGGTPSEDIALQNIQARVRMVLSYLMAQLVPWTRDERGFLLVLGTSNIAEGLRGYLTKYDCSAADINPIGGINKSDLKSFLNYFGQEVQLDVLCEIAGAKPSAELRPFDPKESYSTQIDEEEMGFSYQELDDLGKLRKIENCGPVATFERLIHQWDHMSVKQVADKVKKFYFYYSINRHKMTVLTPSYHAEAYGTDDNRFDLRQFLYDSKWEVQFAEIDSMVKAIELQQNKNLKN